LTAVRPLLQGFSTADAWSELLMLTSAPLWAPSAFWRASQPLVST